MKLKIGQKVKWNGIESKNDTYSNLLKGMEGIVIEHYSGDNGTSDIIGYDDSDPIIDMGYEEYYIIDFGKCGTRCIDKEDIKGRLIL